MDSANLHELSVSMPAAHAPWNVRECASTRVWNLRIYACEIGMDSTTLALA